jgi:ribonuclease G
MVQVQKDPIGTKGARLTTQISIAGRLLVYLPQDSHIGVSQRIGEEAEREKLRARIQALLPADQPGGYILRTVAADAGDEELACRHRLPAPLWQEIKSRSIGALPPMLLHDDLTLAQRVLRDLVSTETKRRASSTRARTSRSCSAFAQEYVPQVCSRLVHYTGERPLFDLHGVEDEIQKALARRVDLKSGGYLIIDQTEAMTTVDVNTGGYVGSRNFDDTIFKTNLEAAQTIARQLRLRNLGGIIIADFIDMEDEEHKAVLAEFNKALAKDHTRITVSGFTQLGLVEMTRKRTRESLAHVLCEPCPTCGGRGEVKTAQDHELRGAARTAARIAPVHRARNAGAGLAERDRPVPRRGIAGAGHAVRVHRPADFPARRARLHAGAVRHRFDVGLKSASDAGVV